MKIPRRALVHVRWGSDSPGVLPMAAAAGVSSDQQRLLPHEAQGSCLSSGGPLPVCGPPLPLVQSRVVTRVLLVKGGLDILADGVGGLVELNPHTLFTC